MEQQFDFNEWGKWGIGDWYGDRGEKLRQAVESGQPFDTGWHGFKETEYGFRIRRTDEWTEVHVSDCMDSALEQYDLFCDFLTEEEQERLTDDMVEQIRDALCMGDFVEEVTDEYLLLPDATFDQIMQTVSKMVQGCDDCLKESFRECIGTTLWFLYGESEATMNLIAERVKQYCPEYERR